MLHSKKKGDKKPARSDEITLRLDGELIAPESFRKAVEAFVDVLIQVSEEIAQGGKKPLWNMSVRHGSAVFVARPVADTQTQRKAKETIKVIRNGFALLEKGKIIVPNFNQQALKAAHELSGLRAKASKPGITTVEIAAGDGRPCLVTDKTSATLDKVIREAHQAHGSIEGRLQTISTRGQFQFVVFDALTGRGINCFVPQEKRGEAHAAFDKRVNVSGRIQYDREGKPVSIKVEALRVMRELSELPEVDYFCGILKPA